MIFETFDAGKVFWASKWHSQYDTGSTLNGAFKALASLTEGCDLLELYTGKACITAGLDTGSMHRTDSYIESNVIRQMREAEGRCKALGLTGSALAICAAPKAGEWTIETGL